MNRDTDRINEIVSKIQNGNACIFGPDAVAPETFAADISGLFNADVDNDVLRNVLVGDEEGLANCTLILIPDSTDANEIFVKLADYVNGIKMKYAFCYCKDKDNTYKMYEFELDDDYVEGGYEPFFGNSLCPVAGEQNIIFIADELVLGVEKVLLPSPTIMFIAQGEHYIDRLIGPDDKLLI